MAGGITTSHPRGFQIPKGGVGVSVTAFFQVTLMTVRQIIFLLVALAIVIPTLWQVSLPITVSWRTQNLYDYIDALPEESILMISFDYGASSFAELEPMAVAVLRHCFSKGIRVIGMTLEAEGATLGSRTMEDVAQQVGAINGDDYVFLGYRPGHTVVILSLGSDFRNVFSTDFSGVPLEHIPLMEHITNYDDISLLLSLCSGSAVEAWVTYGNTRYDLKVATGVTGVLISNLSPYLQTGQLIGALDGMRGAAEYEKLIGVPAAGTRDVNTGSFVHVLIIGLVVIGNVIFFVKKRKK